MSPLALLLAVPSLALAARYDPDRDRADLRRTAFAAYQSAVRAASLDLAPERVPDIKAALDAAVDEGKRAADAAKALEGGAARRASEIEASLKALPEPAADDARARWKSLSADRDGLRRRADELPAGPDKAELGAALDRAGALLADADAALARAEAAAKDAAAAAAAMRDAARRARGPAAERADADGEVVRRSEALPPPVAEAKGAVELIGREPQSVNRTRAGEKLDVPRELARLLLAAADRACNRADDYRVQSAAFDRAAGDGSGARAAGAKALAEAKAALDEAGRALDGVRGRLAGLKPRQ